MPIVASFIILFNTMIPLALYVSMEIIKLAQMVMLQWDVDMYHEESNTPCEARTMGKTQNNSRKNRQCYDESLFY